MSLCTGCDRRFTHANRRCTEHPAAGVRRDRVERENGTSILCANQNITNRQTRTRARSAASSHRLRNRKLFQDLDAAGNENCENSGNDGNGGQDALMCWKKKRAALELQKKEHTQQRVPESSASDEEAMKTQTRDKLLGALALMELSGIPISTEAVLREAEVLMPIAEAEKVLNLYKL